MDAFLLAGSPVDGLVLIGPFPTVDDAIAYGEALSADWWVVEPIQPEEVE